jgi:hypothetical protein
MQDKKEHRTEKLQMISQWQQSGLTQKAFCATNNIAYHVFHYWYSVYRYDQNAAGGFLPVKINTPGIHESITITGHNGLQAHFPFTGQSVGFIKQLLLS